MTLAINNIEKYDLGNKVHSEHQTKNNDAAHSPVAIMTFWLLYETEAKSRISVNNKDIIQVNMI